VASPDQQLILHLILAIFAEHPLKGFLSRLFKGFLSRLLKEVARAQAREGGDPSRALVT